MPYYRPLVPAWKTLWHWAGVANDVRGRLGVLWWTFGLLAALGGFIWYFAIGTFGVIGTAVLLLSALSLLTGVAGGIQHLRTPTREDEVRTYTAVRQPEESAVSASTAAETEEERVLLPKEVTPAYLIGLFQGLTDIQAQDVDAVYVGKWMTVTGALGNVHTGRETIAQVTFQKGSIFDPGHEYFDIYMYFKRPKWDERLSVLPRGAQVTVRGRLRDVNRVEVHLEECELVDLEGVKE